MITGKDILFRSHNFNDLCCDGRGLKLTAKQADTLEKLLARKYPTDIQKKTIEELIAKRDAAPSMGDTGKALVLDIFREVIRGTYKRNIETPAMYKGNEREMFALKRAARVNGWPLPIKYNGSPLRDSIGTGMPDHYVPGKLGNDAKCSKSDEQFMKVFFDDELKNKTYEVQAKRYAIMANLPEWHVSYCLENSPEETIISHAWELWKKGEGEGYITESFIDDVRSLHNFDHLPDWARVKTFVVKPTNEDALYFEGRAKLAREYFDSLLDKYYSNKP